MQLLEMILETAQNGKSSQELLFYKFPLIAKFILICLCMYKGLFTLHILCQ